MTATRIDREQAERVANITLAFYRELCPDASPELLRYLRWAALVHECGMSISSSRYHRHGEYIIKNADMPGFSRREQDMMLSLIHIWSPWKAMVSSSPAFAIKTKLRVNSKSSPLRVASSRLASCPILTGSKERSR